MDKNINSNNWHSIANPEEGAAFLGLEISKEMMRLDDAPLLFFVSGGSCLTVLPKIESNDFGKVTVAVLDERFDQTNENNNFSQLEKMSWSDEFLKKGGTFISTKILGGDTQQKLADRFRSGIEKWINENNGGRMIALFGMGSDGHTAGIFPFPENQKQFFSLFDGDDIVASYDAKEKNQFPKRITATNALFKKLEIAFVYAYGEEKRKALLEFVIGEKKTNELPLMFLKNVKKVNIVTDAKIIL
ncbi:MAG: 6-phosphogluconolactonase [Candidatus Moranbacteria bacterium]|nr:6-phosphogluconolactonase [Candidatus Moranbacteria bacterium]